MTTPTTRYPAPTDEEPTLDDLRDMLFDGDCWATDGCTVEPDGQCQHGHVSWLRHLGIM